MKKIFLITLCLLGFSIHSQTPRLTLYEVFIGENCAPCTTVNPYINTLLAQASFTNKVVAIKWPIPLPTAPSPTWSLYNSIKTDADWRYQSLSAGGYGYSTQWTSTATAVGGIDTVPMGLFNGRHQWSFGAQNDYPGNVNNSIFNNTVLDSSSFAVNITGSWNSVFSALEVTVNITATDTFSASGALVFRTVMVENEIDFQSPPGTNAETSFKDVAIGAFPNLQNGISVAPTWTVGQTQTFTLSCPLPLHTRNKSKISLVGFIQDDGNRKVAQAVRFIPLAIDNDIKAMWTVFPALTCGNSFTPQAVVKNIGNTVVNNLSIAPALNNATLPAIAWSGTLLPGTSATVILGSYTTNLSGGNSFSFEVVNVSGTDFNPSNNTVVSTPYLAYSYPSTSVTEQFSGDFPPPQWGVANKNNGPSWGKSYLTNGPSVATGNGSVKFNFFSNSIIGDEDELILPPLTLTGGKAPLLTFDLAYAPYNIENDRLDVRVSDNCGKTWATLYTKSGKLLATAPAQTNMFVPLPNQWRQEVVPLTSYNTGNVLVKFVAISEFGNNLYLDNVNLVQIDPEGLFKGRSGNSSIVIFPNPAKDILYVSIPDPHKKTKVSLMTAMGSILMEIELAETEINTLLPISVSGFNDGVYLLSLQSGEAISYGRFMVHH